MEHNFAKLYFWSVAYTFSYLSKFKSRMTAIFKNCERLGKPQSDWVAGSWGSPITPLAPPMLEVFRC